MSVLEPQALILAPTRELAQQIQRVILQIGQYMNVKAYVCIGGKNPRRDIRELEKGVHVVVGTPGRVLHLINQGALKPEKIKILCIDEADDMLAPRSSAHILQGRSLWSSFQI